MDSTFANAYILAPQGSTPELAVELMENSDRSVTAYLFNYLRNAYDTIVTIPANMASGSGDGAVTFLGNNYNNTQPAPLCPSLPVIRADDINVFQAGHFANLSSSNGGALFISNLSECIVAYGQAATSPYLAFETEKPFVFTWQLFSK